jgi:hypothetical protein
MNSDFILSSVQLILAGSKTDATILSDYIPKNVGCFKNLEEIKCSLI